MEKKGKNGNVSMQKVEFTDEQTEIFARRIMSEIKRFYAYEKVKKEFMDWQVKKQENLQK